MSRHERPQADQPVATPAAEAPATPTITAQQPPAPRGRKKMVLGGLAVVALLGGGYAHPWPAATDLRTVRLEDISGHYVPTLRQWRERFLASWDELRTLGYDERFRRVWELYLAYCEAGFAERRIQDVQLTLAKPGFRTEPLPELPPRTGRRPPPRSQAAAAPS